MYVNHIEHAAVHANVNGQNDKIFLESRVIFAEGNIDTNQQLANSSKAKQIGMKKKGDRFQYLLDIIAMFLALSR